MDGLAFYEQLPTFTSFTQLTDPASYVPLPDGWALGLADIVQSTAAIDAGRYKTVNTAAAAVNEHQELGRKALGAVAAWVRDNLNMQMRVALVPIAAVRAKGLDVRIARFAPSADASYAMFSGGGLAWAEQQMKAGSFLVTPADPGVRPDLTGLSCRFAEIATERGVIVSLIIVPNPESDPADYRDLIRRVLEFAESREAGHPVPDRGPEQRWPPAGFELEATALGATAGSALLTRVVLGVRTLAAHAIFKTGLRVGGFDPARYRRQLVQNTDFRKFDDGLRMTLDCTAEIADRIQALLAAAQASGLARCGVHKQSAALMTCFVPSPTRSDHVHFVDGAMGGYSAAARALKVTVKPAAENKVLPSTEA